MKLKIFDTRMQNARPDAPPTLHLNSKGVITLNSKACEILHLQIGDQVAIAQDPENTEDWYIIPGLSSGFKLRGTGKGSTQLAFNCVKLTKEFLAAFDLKSNIKLEIVKTPVKHETLGDIWLILTKKAKEQALEEKYKFAKTAK